MSGASYRLRNPTLLRALEFASILLLNPIFQPLHWLVQAFHLVLSQRFFAYRFRSRRDWVKSFHFRHSVHSFANYHILLSDLDGTVVIDDKATISQITELREVASKLRQRFWFLGEIEIYTESELRERSFIEATYGKLLSTIRLIRKIGWVPNDESTLHTPYHGLKARRSHERMELELSRLDAKTERGLFGWQELLSNYIGDGLGNSDARNAVDGEADLKTIFEAHRFLGRGAERISPQFLAFLADLLPPTASDISLERLCRQPELACAKIAMCRYEAAQARGKARSVPEQSSALLGWSEGHEREAVRIRSELSRKGQVLRFNIYGYICDVFGVHTDPSLAKVFQDLSLEFSYFASSDFNGCAQVTIALTSLLNSNLKRSQAGSIFQTQLGLLRWRGKRLHLHGQDFTARISFKEPFRYARFELLVSASTVVANFIHSSIGEGLEKNGYFRLHAAGLIENGRATLFHAPRGAGKSTLVARTLAKPHQLILGDETIFLKDGLAYAYPTPIALRPDNEVIGFDVAPTSSASSASNVLSRVFLNSEKRLMPIPPERVSTIAVPFEVHHVSSLGKSRAAGFTWLFSFTLGLGLPQMKEYMFRFENRYWLPQQALRRLSFAFHLIRHRKVASQSEKDLRNTP